MWLFLVLLLLLFVTIWGIIRQQLLVLFVLLSFERIVDLGLGQPPLRLLALRQRHTLLLCYLACKA